MRGHLRRRYLNDLLVNESCGQHLIAEPGRAAEQQAQQPMDVGKSEAGEGDTAGQDPQRKRAGQKPRQPLALVEGPSDKGERFIAKRNRNRWRRRGCDGGRSGLV